MVESTEDTHELDDMSRRFWIAPAFSPPVFIISMMSDLIPEYLPASIAIKIEPGTAFKDLPKDWVCPVCSVGKEDFRCLIE